MNYQLHREGREAESVSLEELKRRREAGELAGNELVWREGMPDWQWLDSVLEADAKDFGRHVPPPIPAPGKARSKLFVPIITVVVLLAVVEIFWLSRGAVKFFKQVKGGVVQSSAGSDTDAIAIVQQPIKVEKKTETQADVNRRARQFRLRQYLEGYQLRGMRDPQVDGQVEEYLRTWIAVNFGGDDATNYTQPLDELGDRLAANPRLKDPLVLSILGANADDLLEGRRRLDRALQDYSQSNTGVIRNFLRRPLGSGFWRTVRRISDSSTAWRSNICRKVLPTAVFSPRNRPRLRTCW